MARKSHYFLTIKNDQIFGHFILQTKDMVLALQPPRS